MTAMLFHHFLYSCVVCENAKHQIYLTNKLEKSKDDKKGVLKE